jgi:hypothetical protein
MWWFPTLTSKRTVTFIPGQERGGHLQGGYMPDGTDARD